MVANDQSLAAQQGRTDCLEVIQVELPGTDSQNADAFLNFFSRVVSRPQQAGQSGEQRLDLWSQQTTRVEIRQQVLHGQQGMDFFCRKPETG